MTDASKQQKDQPEFVEPEYAEGDPGVQGETNPVTAPNADPAAMSEAERNRRLSETYSPPAS
jgi:hypothetical protein